MSVRKTDEFIADLERQFEWYALNADWEIAERYLDAVETTFSFSNGTRGLGRRAVSSIRDCVSGVSLSCFVRSTSTFCFTKSLAMRW